MQPDQQKPTEEANTPHAADGNNQPPDSGQSVVGGKKSAASKWLWWLLILLILLALLLGWWWFMMQDDDNSGSPDNNTDNSSEEEQASVCGEGLTNYENNELGFGFCYPAEWGSVAVADAKLDASDTGSRWNLSFADQEAVNLGVASADWETSFGRDGVCSDPASPSMPEFMPFSTDWETFDDGSGVSSVDRGIEMMEDDYLIQEYASNTLAEVVCITGYTVLDGTPYGHTTASYSTGFTAAVPDPASHMAAPNTLVPEAERNDFYAFVKSVRDL